MKNIDEQKIKNTLNDIHIQTKYHNKSEAFAQFMISVIYFFIVYFMFYDIIILDMFPTIFNYEPGVGSIILGVFLLGLYNALTYNMSVSKNIRYLKYENNKYVKNFLIFIPIGSFIASFVLFICDIIDDSKYKNNKKELIESITPDEYLYLIANKKDLSVNEKSVLKTEILPALKRSTEFDEDKMFLTFLNKQHKRKNVFNK